MALAVALEVGYINYHLLHPESDERGLRLAEQTILDQAGVPKQGLCYVSLERYRFEVSKFTFVHPLSFLHIPTMRPS